MKKIAVLLIIAVAFLYACSSNKWLRETVVKQSKFTVTFEQLQVEDAIVHQQYSHPFKIDVTILERLMGDLTYVEQVGFIGTEKEYAVFQAVEIDRLAPVLASALSQADDSQRIRFTSYNQGKAFIFSVSRKTEGVVFVEPDGRLNIAFGFINSEIDPTYTTADPPGFSRVDPLKIKSSDTTIIPTGPYAELHGFDNEKPAPMWVIADLEKLAEFAKIAPVPVLLPIVEVKKETLSAPLITETRPITVPKTEITGTAVEPKTTEKTSENLLQQDIKNKLSYLKELLDEGLISEKDYNAKKAELLDKLN